MNAYNLIHIKLCDLKKYEFENVAKSAKNGNISPSCKILDHVNSY